MRMMEMTGASVPGNRAFVQPAAETKGQVQQPVQEEKAIQAQMESPEVKDRDPQEDSSQKQPDGSGQLSRRTVTDPGELSLTFNKEDTFDYIGGESSLEDLDIRKAVSDMRRDRILEQYQYFVGGKPDLEYDGDIDGTVFLK